MPRRKSDIGRKSKINKRAKIRRSKETEEQYLLRLSKQKERAAIVRNLKKDENRRQTYTVQNLPEIVFCKIENAKNEMVPNKTDSNEEKHLSEG